MWLCVYDDFQNSVFGLRRVRAGVFGYIPHISTLQFSQRHVNEVWISALAYRHRHRHFRSVGHNELEKRSFPILKKPVRSANSKYLPA